MSSLSTSAKAIGRVKKKKNQGKKLMLAHSAKRWEFSEFCVTRSHYYLFYIFSLIVFDLCSGLCRKGDTAHCLNEVK